MTQVRQLFLAHYAGESHSAYMAAMQFAAQVARRTQDQLEIVIQHKSTLGNLPEQLHHVIDGEVDMVMPPHDRFSSYVRKFACVSMPFIFDDYAHADRVLDGEFMDWAAPDLLEIGLVFLGNWEWGFRQITNSKRPILCPDDVIGLKIRVPPVLQNRAAIQAMGGNAIPIEFPDLVRAISQGMVDGQENPVSVIHSLKLYETQRYLSILNYNYGAMVHVINKKCFDSLTPEQQQILGEESRAAGNLARTMMRSREEEQITELEKFGVRVDRPDRTPFRLATESAFRIMRAAFGADVVNPFLEMVERGRR